MKIQRQSDHLDKLNSNLAISSEGNGNCIQRLGGQDATT